MGLLALAWAVFAVSRPKPFAPAAFVLPVDASSRIKTKGGWTRRVERPTPVPPERPVEVPAGSRVRVLYPDGRLFLVAGPSRLAIPPPGPAGDVQPMTSLLRDVIDGIPLHSERARSPVRITSPVDVTRFLNPVITWDASEGVAYDIAVIDPADPLVPPRVAQGVRPPLKSEDLATPQRRDLPPDRIHEIVIRAKDGPTLLGAMRFLTIAEAERGALPADPAELLAEAAAAMAKKPTRTGDAYLALSRLPADWAASEPALRLKIKVYADLGLTEEFEKAKSAARSLRR